MNLLSSIRRNFHPLYRLRRLAWFRVFQHAIDPDVWTKTPEGVAYCVKLIRDLSLILLHDGNEEKTRAFLDHLLQSHRPDVFLDIGANVGIYSWLAKARGVPVIFLFEPDPENIRLLAKTIKLHRFDSTFLIPCAVSHRFGAEEFILDQASGATGSLVNHSGNPPSLHRAYGMKAAVSVPTVCLDAYLDYCRGKKVLIKIDVEGAETQVFKGGERFFSEIKPFIIIECFEPDRLLAFRDTGYQIEPLDENGNYFVMPQALQ